MDTLSCCKKLSRLFQLLLCSMVLLTAAHLFGVGQPSTEPAPREVLKGISNRANPSFQADVQFPMDLLNYRADETWNTRIVFDGASKLHLGWLQMMYDEQERLILQNREQLLTAERKRRQSWWIEGNKNAFVDAGTSSLSGLIGESGSATTDRVRQLLTVLFETQLLSDWADRAKTEIVRSGSNYGVRIDLDDSAEDETRYLVVQVDRDRSHVTGVRLIREFQPSYHRPERQEFQLRVDAFHGSSSLPQKLSYVAPDGSEHRIRVSYKRVSDNRSFWIQPAWASSKRENETSSSGYCPPSLFQMTRQAAFDRKTHFQKRLKVFGKQLDRIRDCYEQRSSDPNTVTAPEEDLMQAIRFSTRETYTPSSTTGDGTATAFRTFLRMIRLEEQGRLTSERLRGISLRPFYSTPIQLLAFRSAVKSISSAKSFSKQLGRIAGQNRLRPLRLFVREMEHRLRGIGEQDGVIQENGKEFLVSVQKEMETTVPSTLLMARLYRELGYFEKADAAYAALSEGDDLIPEVKGFIRTAQTDAVKSLNALGIDQIGTRELLYLSGVQVKDDRVSAARQTFQSFVAQYASSDVTLFIDDVQVIRTVVETLLEEEHSEVVQRLFQELVRREGGRFTGRSYLRPQVESVFGKTPDELYMLFRYLREPRDISTVMHLQTAVYHAQSRINRAEADRADFLFLARSIPDLLSREVEGVDKFIEQLKKGYERFSSESLLAERLGDLFWINEDLTKSRTYYRKAIENRSSSFKTTSSEHPLPPVPNYGDPSRLLDQSPGSSVGRQPLLVKFALSVDPKKDPGKAKKLLIKTAEQFGSRTSWMGEVRDPGIAANYQRQYAAWGLYFLHASKKAVQQLQRGIEREQGRYPYGSFEQSSAHSLFRMRQNQEEQEQALSVLRTAANDERAYQKPFRFQGSASQRYVRLLESRDRTADAVDYLRDAVRTEWRQMSEFTYENSATETLTNLLLEEDRVRDAIQVLIHAFYRSLPEQPEYRSGTAPHVLIRTLKKHRHAVDALVVARELSTMYASDPESLQEEIRDLQTEVQNTDLVDVFVKRFQETKEPSVSQGTRERVNQLIKAKPEERKQIEQSLLNREDRIIPLLHKKWRDRSSVDVRRRLRSLIEARGWKQIRSMYERPDLLNS